MIFKIVYWAGVVMQIIIRAPFSMSTRSRIKAERHVSRTENTLLGLLTVAGLVLPLIYSVTNWLEFANYTLSGWIGWIGVIILACGLLIFLRAHMDLKTNWSPTLELYEGHSLITNGIYQHVRHPMYASQLVLSIAQLILLQNWIAGPACLIFFVPFYILRSRTEERMMLEKFRDQYLQYKEVTGGILPKM